MHCVWLYRTPAIFLDVQGPYSAFNLLPASLAFKDDPSNHKSGN